MSTAVKWLRFCLTSWKLNLAGAMEFRMSFLMTAGMMMLNNAIWIFFWSIYFNSFPIVRGWEFRDVMMIQAVVTAGFGWSATLFGNALRIAYMTANGELDTYLTQPKPVLLNVLVSRMSVTAIGDFLFGWIVYAFFGDRSIKGFLLFLAASVLAGLIYLFFHVLTQSLAFYIGNAEGLGHQFFISFITFTTYPTDIFKGLGKLILFTVLPAGFISYMPIGLLREIQPRYTLGLLAVVVLLALFAVGLFYRGLSRYSSGNRMGVRM